MKLLTILLILISLFCCCTEPPKAEFINNFPEILPVGRFYDFKNAIINKNAAMISSMLSENIFYNQPEKFIARYKLSSLLIEDLRIFFIKNILRPDFEDFAYEYDKNGKLITARCYTNFVANVLVRENPGRMRETINDSEIFEPFEKNDDTKINVVWLIEHDNWQILSIVLAGKNLILRDDETKETEEKK